MLYLDIYFYILIFLSFIFLFNIRLSDLLNMKFYSTKLNGVYLIKPYIYKDFRGSYTEIYNKNIFIKNSKKNKKFIQDDISISKKCLKGNTW